MGTNHIIVRAPSTRFLAHVTKLPSGCWSWSGSNNFQVAEGTITTIARASWLLWRGEIQPKHVIATNCGNDACVNPEHLLSQVRPNYNNRSLEERFWEKVKKAGNDECWPWQGSCKEQGYGRISVNKRIRLAHRVSWELHNAPTSLDVLHRCDNPPCVNPTHLFLGTQTDNTADMVAKGRNRNFIGPRKLTLEQVRYAIARRTAGEKLRTIAADLNVSESLISRIYLGKRLSYVSTTS